MDTIVATALWLTTVVGAWAAVASLAGAARDVRLMTSGARALHAAGALMLVALAAAAAGARADAIATTGTASPLALLRASWTAPGGLLLGVAAAAALVAALVTSLVPQSGRVAASVADRGRAHLVAGLIACGAAVTALAARAWWAPEPGAGPVALLHWTGLLALGLYVIGLALCIVPLAFARAGDARATRSTWLLVALATLTTAMVLALWARHVAVAPPPELDVAGSITDSPWMTGQLLLLVPLLAVAAATVAARAVPVHGAARSRTGGALLLIVAAIVLTALGPAVLDWVAQREVQLGTSVDPFHGWKAVVAALLAGVAAVAPGIRAARGPTAAERCWYGAQSAALATLAAASLAVSLPPQELEVRPGVTRVVSTGGRDWAFTSQGTSQVEAATYDGAAIAFLVASGSRRIIEPAGERVYRDARGHPDARVAVPGLVRTLTGDLRFTVRALRGDVALVRVQFHPFATVAWVLAAATVLLLLATAWVTRGIAGETAP